MGHCYGLNSLDRSLVAEPNATAAVYLKIDKTRYEQLTSKVDAS